MCSTPASIMWFGVQNIGAPFSWKALTNGSRS